MLKTRYVVASASLLLIIFATVMFFLPTERINQATKGNTYIKSVFDQSKVTNVEINIADKDLSSILRNPTQKEIVNADVTINGETIKNVGFRAKGNLSLNSVVQMEDSDRYSWKIDFNYYQKDQDLHGLKKLALNNNYSDPTFMREYLSYELMEKMGVPTPAHSYMYVTINGKEWGLYTGVEAIEETFLDTNFTDGTGDLYYPDGTGSDLKWISDDINDYTGLNLKTNLNSNQSAMLKMLDVINHGGDLEKVLHVDEMLRYFAANTALVNLDHYQGMLKHNYYLYEEDGIFSILPWDYNMSFGGFSGGGGGPTGGREAKKGNDAPYRNAPGKKEGASDANMTANFMSESSVKFSITNPVMGTTLEDRPLLNALLSNEEYRKKYRHYLKDIAKGYFTEDNMTKVTNEITALITPYVEKDPTKFYTMDEFITATSGDETLVDFASQRADSILAQLSGDEDVEVKDQKELDGLPSMADEPDGNMKPPNIGDGPIGDMKPPDVGDGPTGDRKPPNIGDGPDGNWKPPGMGERMMAKSRSTFDKGTILLTSLLLLLLTGAIVFTHSFKRRGRKG